MDVLCKNCGERIVPVTPGSGWNHIKPDGYRIWSCEDGQTHAEPEDEA